MIPTKWLVDLDAIIKYATGMLMYVIAVNKSQEFLINVRRLLYIFSTTDKQPYRQTNRRDRNYIPRRFASGKKHKLNISYENVVSKEKQRQ